MRVQEPICAKLLVPYEVAQRKPGYEKEHEICRDQILLEIKRAFETDPTLHRSDFGDVEFSVHPCQPYDDMMVGMVCPK